MKEVDFANSVDSDEGVQYELPHLDLHWFAHCLLNSQFDVAWIKHLLKFC